MREPPPALAAAPVTELWREAVRPYRVMIEEGADMVVAEAGIRYREPARFDDEIDLLVSVRRLGETSITIAHAIERVGDAALLVEGELRHVFVDPGISNKRALPPEVRRGLEPLLTREAAAAEASPAETLSARR